MRRALSSVLACLAALCLVLAAGATWTSQTVLDTDRFVADVGPVIDQQPVRDAIADEVSTQVAALVHVPVAATLVRTAIGHLVAQPSFRPIWLAALRVAHGQVVAALVGPPAADPALRRAGREIRLDFIAVAANVLKQLPPVAVTLLGAHGRLQVPADASAAQVRSLVARFLGHTLPVDFATVPLLPTSDLDSARTYVRWLDGAAPVLLVIGIVLVLVALVLSRRRSLTLAEVGLWFAVLLVVGYFLVRGAGTGLTTGLSSGTARPVAVAVVAALFDSLRSPATVLALVGAAVAVAGVVLTVVVGSARRLTPG